MDDGKFQFRVPGALLWSAIPFSFPAQPEGWIPSSHCESGSPYVRARDINSDLSSLQSKGAPDVQQSLSPALTAESSWDTTAGIGHCLLGFFTTRFLTQTAGIYRQV